MTSLQIFSVPGAVHVLGVCLARQLGRMTAVSRLNSGLGALGGGLLEEAWALVSLYAPTCLGRVAANSTVLSLGNARSASASTPSQSHCSLFVRASG